jgi:hypothetical protein
MNNKTSEYIYGTSAIISQLGGFLFLENVKMEKQRTNLPYNKIIPLYLKPKTFINGFFPYGIIQAFSKGFIFGLNQNYVRPYLNYKFDGRYNQINNLLIGLSTGITESIITSPILYIRNNLNISVTEKNNNKLNLIDIKSIRSIFKGCNILIAKRCVDWSTRFILIDLFKKNSPIDNILFNTFMGASISAIFSSPIDRLLPIVYSNKSIKEILYTQKLNFFYKGFVFRFLSTGHYTCCILLLPNIISNNNF